LGVVKFEGGSRQSTKAKADPLVSCVLRRKDCLRFGGEAEDPRGRREPSLPEDRPPSLSFDAVENRRPLSLDTRLAERASPFKADAGRKPKLRINPEESDEQGFNQE